MPGWSTTSVTTPSGMSPGFSPLTVASGLVVASGLAPRWAAKQPPLSYPRHTEQTGFGAASPPNGGQAPSPHLPRQPAYCGQRAYCGERACPALGCAAAPTNPPQFLQAHRASRFWGGFATQRGTSPLATFTAPACLLWAEGLLWRAGLPRAGLRSSPNKPTPVSPGTPRRQVLGRLRHPTGDKPPRHNKPLLHNKPPLHSGSRCQEVKH